ncbi:MAG TPA: ATP-dependent zinc metalloprotease FtsH [Candidatus Xenobia bacterium]|jgi:cell division protease FtsH
MPVDPRKPKKTDLRHFHVGWTLLVLVAILYFFNLSKPQTAPSTLPYSTFLQQLGRGEVSAVVLSPDTLVYGLRGDRLTADSSSGTALPDNLGPYRQLESTVPPPDDRQLVPRLTAARVPFTVVPPQRSSWLGNLMGWLVPLILFMVFWGWMLRRAGSAGPLTVGKSRARIYSEGQTGITFAEVAGVEEAKAELVEVVDFLKHADKYVRVGAKIPKGVLLVGPPGSGKTLLAKAVAGEASVPFYSISGSEFIELFVGVGASRVRDLFEQAKQKAPCIVFIDELDALGKSRAAPGPMLGGNDEREQTLNQLLTEMDGFEPNLGVVILAATNRPEVLDPALRRPGRFDRIISVDAPDRRGREAILRVHVKGVPLGPDIDLEAIARRTPGFVGADLANLVNEAALRAARESRLELTAEDFSASIDRVVAGLEKKSRLLSERERTVVAHHESGHAIVGHLMPGAARVEKISIVPRGMSALGYTWQVPQEEHYLVQEDELRGKLATMLGGRAAEQVIFGKLSTGAADDLQKATDLAERAVTMYGLSKLGPVAMENLQQGYLEAAAGPRRGLGPETAQEIDGEIRRFLLEAEDAAIGVLRANEAVVRRLAQELLAQEVLEGNALQATLGEASVPPAVRGWLQGGDRQPQPSTVETKTKTP